MTRDQLNIRVSDSTKTEWKEHVEADNRFNNLSELIRFGVSQVLRDEKRDDVGELEYKIEEMYRMTIQTNELMTSLSNQIDNLEVTTPNIQDIQGLEDRLTNIIESEDDDDE